MMNLWPSLVINGMISMASVVIFQQHGEVYCTKTTSFDYGRELRGFVHGMVSYQHDFHGVLWFMVNLNGVNMTLSCFDGNLIQPYAEDITINKWGFTVTKNVGYIVWRIYQYKPTFCLPLRCGMRPFGAVGFGRSQWDPHSGHLLQ